MHIILYAAAGDISTGNFGPGTGRIWMDEVGCTGTEEELLFCPFILNHNCDHSQDVEITCIAAGI